MTIYKRALIGLAALLACGLLFCAACAESARDITSKCSVRVSNGQKRLLTDRDVTTYWGPWGVGSRVGIKLPDQATAGALVIEWYKEPGKYTIGEYTEDRTLIRERTQDDTFESIISVWPLDPGTRNILLTIQSEKQMISSIAVLSQGDLPAALQTWDPPWEKADIMVVSTHQDDEFIYLGGTIPYYAVARGMRVTVVYMADCGRYRRNEALRGLWAVGLRNYPEFINLKDMRIPSFDESVALWGGKSHVLEVLVARIRRYKPEVIVTHDLNGEYGHNQHKITARAMKYAIVAAADPERFPKSAEKYGTWQVKKLYNHLYKKNRIKMDWTTKLPELGGRSPLKMAKIGYAEHASQHAYFQVVEGGPYDNALFGLAYSTVGKDIVGGDMMENIPAEALDPSTTLAPEWLPLSASVTPEPATEAPSPAPVETPVPTPTAAPSPEPTQTPASAPTAESKVEKAVEFALVQDDVPGGTPSPVRTTAEPPRISLASEPAVQKEPSHLGTWIGLGGLALLGAAGFAWLRLAPRLMKGKKKRTGSPAQTARKK